MDTKTIYVDGLEVTNSVREYPLNLLNLAPELREKLDNKLKEFLYSDKEVLEICFEGDIVPHRAVKAKINIKTCGNNWTQYEIVVLNGYPSLIGRPVGSFAVHGSERAVMLNEVLTNDYADSKSRYIPLGYNICRDETNTTVE